MWKRSALVSVLFCMALPGALAIEPPLEPPFPEPVVLEREQASPQRTPRAVRLARDPVAGCGLHGGHPDGTGACGPRARSADPRARGVAALLLLSLVPGPTGAGRELLAPAW